MVLLDVKTILWLEALMEALRDLSSGWKGKPNVLIPVSDVGCLGARSMERYLVLACEITPLIKNAGYSKLIKSERMEGLEPSTSRLPVWHAADCATQAISQSRFRGFWTPPPSQLFALKSFKHTIIHTCVWVQIPHCHLNNFYTSTTLKLNFLWKQKGI